MRQDTIMHWFRQDLRLQDNPALLSAAQQGRVLAVYILDDEGAGEQRMGAASRWWLHHSLVALNRSLDNKLCVYQGDAKKILTHLVGKFKVRAVHWNHCYEPWRVQRDGDIKQRLTSEGITVNSFNGSLLWEPWQVLKKDHTPYRVFTPYYRKGCLAQAAPREPLPQADQLHLVTDPGKCAAIDSLGLLPGVRWDRQLEPHWCIGEAGAHERLDTFIDENILSYREGRNLPARPWVSRLSPHLHFGEISPNQAWYAARARGDDVNVDTFCSELGWREFSHNLLYHNPDLPRVNLQRKFDAFPWRRDSDALRCWQQGQTGYPIVDAGMRELWQSGYMHNRVRMIVGSFLVKNLLLDWRHGERWFWDCLVDADLANNSAGWQWIAGCGADAAPYFRIFNPVTQGEKFDSEGAYTRRFVPELARLDTKYLFKPWLAPQNVLNEAGIELGRTYPGPLVDLKLSRERALAAFQSIK